jgi:rhamnose utilization protein RhaD (predicted bifunctional aldolase and dehydrogenase)
MSTATQNAVAIHGDKAVLAYELVGAVAAHIPYVRQAYGLCNEIVHLFGASVHIDGTALKLSLGQKICRYNT